MTDNKIENNDKNDEKKDTKIAERTRAFSNWIAELDSWFDDFNKSFFGPMILPFGDVLAPVMPFAHVPVMDIEETPTEYKIRAELPGLAKDDVTVTLEDGRLKISAEKKQEEEKKEKRFLRKERRYESFYREIRVPDDAETGENIDAKLEDGMLNITLKRKPQPAKEKKEIKVE